MIISKLQNFISTTSRKVTGKLGDSIASAVSCDQGVLNSVLSKVSYLKKSIDLATCWTNIFSALSNEIPTDTNLRLTVQSKLNGNINYAKHVIDDGIQFIRDNYGDKFTITDASGLLYNLYLSEDEWIENGKHIKSVVKTSVRNGIDDCLFYYEDGILKFNQIARSANFSMPISFTEHTEILDGVGAYCFLHKLNFDGSFSSIPGEGTIKDRLIALGATGDTIIDMINSISVVTEGHYSGKVKLWWDIMRDYIQSTELNANLYEVISALSAGTKGFTNFMSSVAVRINNAMSSIKKFWIDLSNAFAQGGFKGAVYFIYNFFKNGSSMTDKDGCLSFTDNSALVPKQYIAGMVSTIFTVVTSLAAAILAAINPVIGVVVGSAGALLYGVFKSISFDERATNIGIQTSERVVIPAAPYACFQDEFIPSPDFAVVLNDYPVAAYEVPGGFLIVGPGSFNDDGSIATCKAEFHPSVCRKIEPSFFTALLSNCNSEYIAGTAFNVQVNLDFNIYKNFGVEIAQHWANADSVLNVQNESNDRVSDWNDSLLCETIGINTFTFLYWYGTLFFEDHHNITGHYQVHHDSLDPVEPHFWTTLDNMVFNTDENFVKLMQLFAPVNNKEGSMSSGKRPLPWGITGCTWEIIANQFDGKARNNYSTGLPAGIINDRQFFGDPIQFLNNFDWAVIPPIYDSATFLRWIVITSIALAVTATVAVVTTFKVKKFIQNKRAEMNSAVETAWSEYGKGNISYDEYRKTVKKANRWQTFIGGTRYDYENYWNGDTSGTDANTESSDPDSVSTVSTICTDLVDKIYTPNESISTDAGKVSLESIRLLITGA